MNDQVCFHGVGDNHYEVLVEWPTHFANGHNLLRGGFKYFLFSPLLVEDFRFD